MQNSTVMWSVSTGTLDMTKWSNDMFLLQMTLHLLTVECIGIYVELILQGCLILTHEVLQLKRDQRCIHLKNSKISQVYSVLCTKFKSYYYSKLVGKRPPFKSLMPSLSFIVSEDVVYLSSFQLLLILFQHPT